MSYLTKVLFIGLLALLQSVQAQIINEAGDNTLPETYRINDTDPCNIDVLLTGGYFEQECGGGPFTYEGKLYHTVEINGQCWMKENLNVGTRISSSTSQTDNAIVEKYCYDNLESNCDLYGGLYQWGEMMDYEVEGEDNQGICPPGWTIPSEDQWDDLLTYVSTLTGKKLRITGLTYWSTPNVASNMYCFSAMGAGIFYTDGNFYALKTTGQFWSAHHIDGVPANSWSYRIDNTENEVLKSNTENTHGFSIRCIYHNPT